MEAKKVLEDAHNNLRTLSEKALPPHISRRSFALLKDAIPVQIGATLGNLYYDALENNVVDDAAHLLEQAIEINESVLNRHTLAGVDRLDSADHVRILARAANNLLSCFFLQAQQGGLIYACIPCKDVALCDKVKQMLKWFELPKMQTFREEYAIKDTLMLAYGMLAEKKRSIELADNILAELTDKAIRYSLRKGLHPGEIESLLTNRDEKMCYKHAMGIRSMY